VTCLVAALLVSLFYACRKADSGNDDISSSGVARLDVNAAKDYYDQMVKTSGNLANMGGIRTMSTKAVQNRKYALFQKVHEAQTDSVWFVELPLLYNKRSGYTVGNADAAAGNNIPTQQLNSSFDRLIIYKNKNSGKISQRIVTYIPDPAYLNKHHNDASANQLDHLQADFSGYIAYKSWDETPLFTLKIVNGKPVHRFNAGANRPASVQVQSTGKKTMQTVCTDYYVYHFETTCWYTDPEHTENETCDDWVLVGMDYLGQQCYDDGDPNDPCINPTNFDPQCVPSGGTVPPSPDTIPASHQLPNKSKLPPRKTTDTQDYNTCTFKVLEWISKYFNGNLTVSTMITGFANAHSPTNVTPSNFAISIYDNGITNTELYQLLDMYFNYSTTNSMYQSINDGYPMIGTIMVNGAGHEVFVTGYNTSVVNGITVNTTMEYFDPLTGTYNETTVSTDIHNVRVITSQK